MKNAVILGLGVVGNATKYALGIEKYYSLDDKNIELEEISDYKYIFICLPTPTYNGVQNTKQIVDYIVDIAAKKKDNIFIIRSTVLPGFCRSIKHIANIVHVPEFLTESTWRQDSEWPDIIVVGADDNDLRDDVVGIYRSRYKGADFFTTDLTTSEMIKYAINTFYATKVVFANQLYDFCKKNKVNYETVKKAMYARKWIAKNHLSIWFRGGRGASGKCLRKDLDAFANASKLPFFEVVNEINKKLLRDFPQNEILKI